MGVLVGVIFFLWLFIAVLAFYCKARKSKGKECNLN